MIRLVLDLLSDRVQGEAVPVLVTIAGWDPTEQDLHDWLSAHLTTVYPQLTDRAKRGARTSTVIRSLMDARLILPIFDGLDELPNAFRELAILRINEALRPDEPLVVTCRTREFMDTVQSPDHGLIRLRATAAVELRPLDLSAVADYLRHSSPSPATAARWDPVLNVLGTQAPVAQALTTPLMVGLARAIYSPLPGDRTVALPDPARLCSPAFHDRAAVESFLFSAFVPAIYRRNIKARWRAADAGRWLKFLAAYLEHTIVSPDLAWWRLAKATPIRALGLAVGVVLGLVLGSVGGLVFGIHSLELGMAAGLVPGLAMGFGLGGDRLPSHGVTWRPIRAFRIGVPIGIVAFVSGAVIYGVAAGLMAALLLALLLGFAAGLQSRGGRLAVAPSPQAALRSDRRTALVIGTMTAVAVGGPIGIATGFSRSLTVGITLGIVCGIAVGSVAISYESAWPEWLLARCWLFTSRRLPWRLMAFLEDADHRGALRQVGAVYQFRHMQLQRSLASHASLTDDIEPVSWRF